MLLYRMRMSEDAVYLIARGMVSNQFSTDAWVVRCTKSASRHGLQLKRIFNVLGAAKLTEALRRA
jgi:hypothetical protein